jgi:heat shock protein HslJ
MVPGCNIGTTSYTAYSNGDINFGGFAMTNKLCSKDIDDRIIDTFQKSKSFSKTGDLISLKDSKGIVTMNLMPK